ncbi:MAG: serine protease AprX [Cryptosporangiaceae bacterium]|nr:serine protease AprX [Cryptosporangiaceae bacterium]
MCTQSKGATTQGDLDRRETAIIGTNWRLAARSVIALGVAGAAGLSLTSPAAAATAPNNSWIWDTTQTQLASAAWTIGADAVWSRGVTGTGIGVALVDTGVSRVPGLDGSNIVYGPDLSFESQDATLRYQDDFGHGTHLAGIIAGKNTVSADGFSGIAPGVKLTSIKVGVANGAVDVSQTIAAIDWAVENRNADPSNPIRVINLAYGTPSTQDYRVDPLAFAVENAWRKGIVVVAAAGNTGQTGRLTDPATDPYVIAVGAADTKNTPDGTDDTVASFSSRGTSARTPDVVAPGRTIASLRDPGSYVDTNFSGARRGSRFFVGSGSSQASAMVSGAVALMLQARPSLTPDAVKNLIKKTARPVKTSVALDNGIGMLNVWDAYQYVIPSVTQTWTRATGTGSLEKARGGVHVVDNGVVLSGENDIFGPFNSATWASATAGGTAWDGGKWLGRDMTGTTWTTSGGAKAWSGRTWSGRTWSGRTWSGRTWSGNTWSGLTWDGAAWI